MRTLLGRGSSTGDARGPILARAARLVENSAGRLTLAEELLAEAARREKRNEDPLDIVLVTRDAGPALFLRLPPGLALVGVVGEAEMFGEPGGGGIAIVTGVEDAREAIQEGEWLIVEAGRDQVLVEPDVAEIARLQAPAHTPRVLLGAAHTPARTQSGLTISVWAAVAGFADIEDAMDAGADGIVLFGPGELLPSADFEAGGNATTDAAFSRLSAAVEAVGGGDVGVYAGPDVIDPAVIVALAPRCHHLRWLLRPDEMFLPLADLRAELQSLVDEETAAKRLAALPLLCAVASAFDRFPADEGIAPADFDEIALTAETPDALPPLSAAFRLPPLRVWLAGASDPESLADTLPAVVFSGAAGIITAPSLVGAAKDSIRSLE